MKHKHNFRMKSNLHYRYLLIITFLFLYPSDAHSQPNMLKFEHVTYEEGIPHNWIYAIYQDRTGYMWFGTMYGLIKYDGHRYTEFKHDPDDSNSISFDYIISIFEDRIGNLWIGTMGGGLNKYDVNSGNFKHYFHDRDDSTSINNNTIWSIAEDDMGRLWFGTQKGLNRFVSVTVPDNIFPDSTRNSIVEKKTEFFVHYKDIPNDPNSLDNKLIRSVYVDRSGRLWVGVYDGGVYLYDPESDNFYRLDSNINNVIAIYEDRFHTLWTATRGSGLYKIVLNSPFDFNNKISRENVLFLNLHHDPSNPQSLSSNNIRSIGEDRHGDLWIGSDNGLSRLTSTNRMIGRFDHFKHDASDVNSISSDDVASIFEDKSGILWIGTYRGGIDKLIPGIDRFEHFKNNPSNRNSINHNDIGAIIERSNSDIWVGSFGGGLTRITQSKENKYVYNHFRNIPGNTSSLSSNYVTAIYEDKSKTLWIGTANGLNEYVNNRSFKRYLNDLNNGNSISSDFVTSIIEDRKGMLWIGTKEDGLNCYNKYSDKFFYFKHDPEDTNSINNEKILSLFEDSEGNIWVGTFNGLDKLDIKNPDLEINQDNKSNIVFKHFKTVQSNPNTISDNNVLSIYEDNSKVLWFGTRSGLNKYDKASNQFTRYLEKDGLPNFVVCGILGDENDCLWLSTLKGLSRFNTKNEIFKNYDVTDGLQSNIFNPTVYAKCKNGKMLFGGINGFNRFHPDSVLINSYRPPVVITAFKKLGKESKFEKNISIIDEFQLTYKDEFFIIEFAALDYTNPLKNQYSYMLEGYDEDWIYCGNKNSASYTNLPPGEYIFKIKGSNNDGVWNEDGRSVKIIMSAPFWEKWWFKVLMVLIVTGGFVFTISFIKIKEKKKTDLNNKIAELKLQALRSQMNPHFVFNTINSIQYFLTCNDQRSALNYLSKFSKLMRNILQTSHKSKITIEEELESLRLFLELEHLRFENKFKYQIDVDPNINIHSHKIPAMLIQPYVENAIKHGLNHSSKLGFISIKLQQLDNNIVCTIEDNGIGIQKSLSLKDKNNSAHKSSGMDITQRRLNILNINQKDSGNIEIFDLTESDKNATGTKVKIQIPITMEADDVIRK